VLPAAAALLLAVAVGVWAGIWGTRRLDLSAAPFAGHYDLRLGGWTPVLLAVALLAHTSAPWLARLGWRRLLLASSAAAVVWSLALALVDGVQEGLLRSLRPPGEYLHDVGRVHGVHSFLSTFSDQVAGGPDPWTTQVAGHPPALLLLLAGMRQVGLGGPWPLVVLFVLAGCSTVAAVLIAVRAVCGEATARACAPFLPLAPAAVWVAVSADALFMAVAAWGLAGLAVGRARSAWSAPTVLGGAALGTALMLSYSVVPLGALALALVASKRQLLAATAGLLVVFGFFTAEGFWWFDGLSQTLVRVRAGDGGTRPYEYFLLANLAVLGVALGPAAVTGLTALRRADPLWRLVAPVLLAVLVSDVSGASRGEVERIWLPFVPWLVVATARLDQPRRWLAVQLLFGLVLVLLLRAKW
jgi:hypothetical protein